LTLAEIKLVSEEIPSQMSQWLFSPNSLSPSIKNSNPTVHFESKHWAMILVYLSASNVDLEDLLNSIWVDLEKIISTKQVMAHLEIERLEHLLNQCTKSISHISDKLHGIRFYHRHFSSDIKLSARVFDLEA